MTDHDYDKHLIRYAVPRTTSMVRSDNAGGFFYTAYVEITALEPDAQPDTTGQYKCPYLRQNPFQTWDGKSAHRFENDKYNKFIPPEYRRYPDYMQLIFRRMGHQKDYEEAKAAMQKMDFKNPKDVRTCLNKRWLGTAEHIERLPRIAMDIHPGFRTYKAIRAPLQPYQREDKIFLALPTDLFESYDEALEEATARCMDYINHAIIKRKLEWHEDVEQIMAWIPEEERGSARMMLSTLSWSETSQLGFDGKKVYFRTTPEIPWETIYETRGTEPHDSDRIIVQPDI